MTETLSTTWDGLPISPQPPFGASIIVYRKRAEGIEFLILHRAHHGPSYEGDWAWTPPSGSRLPNEPIDECAHRELLEETGLVLSLQTIEREGESWALYSAEAPLDAVVTPDAEHDRFAWVKREDALARCLPEAVGGSLQYVAHLLTA